ncbi:OmpA family protein [Flavobacterium ponti]|uniref:OmpA family protein n=1 Tax=Flavobacterium ponti TaxID=665133 RepID=A0ABV9P822_9FLAO
MKTIIVSILFLFSFNANAQFLKKLSKKAEEAAKRSVERKVEQKSEKTTDKAVDKVLNPEKKSKTEGNSTSSSSSKKDKKTKSAKSANDFIAGTKIIATENFSQDAIGDFPVNWSTNSSGEVVTFDGENTRWLKLNDNGNYTPNTIKKLADNFTFEFDLYSSEDFSFYSTALKIGFIETKKKNDYTQWKEFQSGKDGVIVSLHPQLAGTEKVGGTGFFVIDNGSSIMNNNVELNSYTNNQNTAKIQFWRQKNRLRMYVNGEKVWDLPNAFQDANYNTIVFFIHGYNDKKDKYYISNLKLAEAGADTRHTLIETGTFTTNEILFDTNKSIIKNSSTAVLNELGKALQENPTIKVSITGHTDSDGKEMDNQKLSEQRAESVKNYLVTNFGIDKNKITTNGKGENSPIADNTKEEGKKQNRRVEFNIIK